ncbi:hypothetical protein TEA_014309 [Camellia sinensis var. sinensis]|uniref:Longin domain-containing protein n=1 Tax=Camellia sinensis var. sinensis TaxID=542762 RepID=A0A4S4EC68_CAMSN|nr:hypothetical protein TEA_014309 [Camellia sinensis var. sinensis]
MGQQSLIYSFVARGTVVLAEFTEFTGNFTSIASQCLQKLPATNNKFTYNCDGHTFNYLVEDGFSQDLLRWSKLESAVRATVGAMPAFVTNQSPKCESDPILSPGDLDGVFSILDISPFYCCISYVSQPSGCLIVAIKDAIHANNISSSASLIQAYCVVAVESAGRQIPMAFLDRVKEDFTKRYGGGKAATAVANSLNKEFGPKLKEQMQYCVDHPEEISKLSKVKAQVSEVKGVMMENIEKVLDRGEKIELLVDKTENLRSQSLSRLLSKCHVTFLIIIWGCTRFQDPGYQNEEEDVVAEYEDKAYSSRNPNCLNFDHSFIGLWWPQMSLVNGASFTCFG